MKKIILLTLAVLLLAVILFFYISFNGNFISKMIAKSKVQQYVEEMYENQNKQLVDSYYNFKDGQYTFNYEIYNNTIRSNYSFSIGGPFFPKGTIFSYLEYESMDEALTESFQKDGEKWLEEQLREQNIAFGGVGYAVDIPKGLYGEDEVWKPNVDKLITPRISVDLTDEQQTEEQFLQQAEQIRQILIEHDVTYANGYISLTRAFDNSDGSKVGYAETYYQVIYSTRFTPDTKNLTVY